MKLCLVFVWLSNVQYFFFVLFSSHCFNRLLSKQHPNEIEMKPVPIEIRTPSTVVFSTASTTDKTSSSHPSEFSSSSKSIASSIISSIIQGGWSFVQLVIDNVASVWVSDEESNEREQIISNHGIKPSTSASSLIPQKERKRKRNS